MRKILTENQKVWLELNANPLRTAAGMIVLLAGACLVIEGIGMLTPTLHKMAALVYSLPDINLLTNDLRVDDLRASPIYGLEPGFSIEGIGLMIVAKVTWLLAVPALAYLLLSAYHKRAEVRSVTAES